MLDDDTALLLVLQRLPGLPEAQLARLLAAVAKPCEILNLSASKLQQLELSGSAYRALSELIDSGPGAGQQQLSRDLDYLDQHRITLLSLASPDYPELLKQIADPPPLLYARGNCALLNRPQLAMVGSRKTSSQGLENAYAFARALADSGFTIVSGLAAGIDSRSHRGALDTGGDTVAVLGTGIGSVYPPGNSALFAEIAECGLLLSEFPIGTGPRRHHFPKRNRIISGMSLAVLVVEAALQSGSLITARLALEQNREVMAIPGSIHHPGGRGCNALIRQGATLVETVGDVLEQLQGWLPRQAAVESTVEQIMEERNISDRERQLLDLLGFDPVSIELLQRRSSWSAAELVALLTALELKGLVGQYGGHFQQLVPATRN